MSLLLLMTTAFDRMRVRARQLRPDLPPATPRPERPSDRRARLRRDVLARGGVLTDIETIFGDCPDQMRQQIGDLSRWLEQHPSATPVR